MFKYTNKSIETDRLLLRLFDRDDGAEVTRMCNNYNVYKSTLSLSHPYTLECALSWIERSRQILKEEKAFQFAVTDKESKELYGCIGLSYSKIHNNGEIGYWIGEEHWGRGYATEATIAMIKFAFEEKGYHRVFARHFISNQASGKVMIKADMTYEGMQREHIYKFDHYEDIALYGIINSREQ